MVELIEAVLERTSLERLRISSLGVEFMTDRLIALFANPRINAYVHLSIQSGSSNILKAMHRHYDGEQVRSVLRKIRSIKRPDGTIINIGADLIVGFPGETDDDFLDTENLVRDFQITQLHAFPFSAHLDHYNVPAGTFPDQIPNHIAQKRLKHLMKVGKEAFMNLSESMQGKIVRVLIEKRDESQFSGWSENYLFCNASNIELSPGQDIRKGMVVEGVFLRLLEH